MTLLRLNQKRPLKEDATMLGPSPAVLMLVALLLISPMEGSAFSSLATESYTGSRASISADSRNPTTATRLGRLNYRNGDEEDTKCKRRMSSIDEDAAEDRWWGGLVSTSPKAKDEEEEASQRVDEYLKFLDKRYHQIHDNDQASAKPAPVEVQKSSFPVMRWLHKEDFEPNKADALSALGLAAESAEALSQPSAAALQQKEIKVAEGERVSEELSSIRNAVRSMKQSPSYQKVARSRKALLRYQTQKFYQFAVVAAKALKKVPEVPSLLLKLGGGKKPLTIALGVLSVVILNVLLPAVGSFLKESVMNQA